MDNSPMDQDPKPSPPGGAPEPSETPFNLQPTPNPTAPSTAQSPNPPTSNQPADQMIAPTPAQPQSQPQTQNQNQNQSQPQPPSQQQAQPLGPPQPPSQQQAQPLGPPQPPSQQQAQPPPPLIRPPPQSNTSVSAPPPLLSQAAPSSTSGLLDRTGDKSRTAGPSQGNVGMNPMGGMLGLGNQMQGGGMNGPRPSMNGPPNRPAHITIPSGLPSAPNSNGMTPFLPPNSAINTPAGSTANTPTNMTGTTGFPGHGGDAGGRSSNNTYTAPHPPPSSSHYARAQQQGLRMLGQSDRTVQGQGKLFTESLGRELAKKVTDPLGLKATNSGNPHATIAAVPVDGKSLTLADHGSYGVLAELLRMVAKAKDHRVAYTNPRPAPFWPTKGGEEAKVKKDDDAMDVDSGSKEKKEDKEVPMWNVEILDDPGKQIALAHHAITESEKAKKTARWRERNEYEERKRREAEGRRDSEPAGNGQEGSGALGPGAEGPSGGPSREISAGPSTPMPSTPGLVAPDTLMDTPAPKKKPAKKNPQADADLAEKRRNEATNKEATRAMGSILGKRNSRFAWMGGAGSGSPMPKTPLPSLGGNKGKRALLGTPGSAPGTPGSPGMRGRKRPLEGTPLGMAKRQRNGSGLINESSLEPAKPMPYQFAQVEDNVTKADYLTVLRRQVRKGGPLKVHWDKYYQEMLVKAALEADEKWRKENAGVGSSTIAGGTAGL